MLDLLGPAQVADVDHTVNTFLKLDEYAEVGEVADSSDVLGVDGVLLGDGSPRIRLKLLQTEGHLALFAVECEDDCLDFLTDGEEILCAAQVERPGHLGNVEECLYARLYFDECAVICNDDNLTLDNVTDLEVRIKSVPRMR